MAEHPLKHHLTEAMKTALKGGEKQRLAVIRLILADFKRVEVDKRIEIDDERALALLDKMAKQRRDSIQQYKDAGRNDLADAEAFELSVIQEYLPQPFTPEQLSQAIDAAISACGASSMADMGRVMAELKPRLQGRADMASVSKQVKQRLSGQ